MIAYTVIFSMILSACASGNDKKNNGADVKQTKVENYYENASKSISKDVYIVPQKLDNPDLVIVWDTSEEAWKETIEKDPNAFNLVWTTKDAFEKMYGGHVTVYGVGWGEMMNTALEMVEKGEACDLVQANDQNFPNYSRKNAVVDISQYINLDDDFWYDNVTEAFTFGGVPYVVGAEATPVVISFNKTLFEENL